VGGSSSGGSSSAAGGSAGSVASGGAAGSGFGGPISAESALRKIKNVLTGLAVTDAELATGKQPGGLTQLLDAWTATPEFDEKMIFFFSNAFQQSSLSIADFQFQLRKRPGAFDLPYGIYGDDAFPMLFKNMKESFARTAVAFVAEGKPLTDLLTTKKFMMTSALKSLYLQIEAPYDIHDISFGYNHGRRPKLEDTLNPSSPDYLIFGYEAPTTVSGNIRYKDECTGKNLVSYYPGNTHLFHLLLGSVGRDSANNGDSHTGNNCWEKPAKPYFTAQDLSDWQMVEIVDGAPLMPWELIKIRSSGGTLKSRAPRVSFFSTPAFFAVWNTNDSNGHRVTANQALLAAIGVGYTSADSSIPIPPDTAAVNGEHAVDSSECYVCHKSLDPMRQFWGKAYDFNNKPGGGGPAPSFGFANVTESGSTLVDFGNFLKQVTDERVAGDSLSRFGLEMTQKLCFFANSAKCEETDPEMRRVARTFQEANFDFKVLVKELFSSPLVTASEATETFAQNGVTVSITRRDQLCQALSNRLGVKDLCDISLPVPPNEPSAMSLLAGALPADAFSRGVAAPVTAADPTLFYRAASELLCEAIAGRLVDAQQGSLFSSSDPAAAIADMVTRVMGVPATDPKHEGAVDALSRHFAAAEDGGESATSALRSTFSAACQSPPSLALGI
jgi:hypothetical protein